MGHAPALSARGRGPAPRGAPCLLHGDEGARASRFPPFTRILEGNQPWAGEHPPPVEGRIGDRPGPLAAHLGGAGWLSAAGFSAGDRPTVPLRLRGGGWASRRISEPRRPCRPRRGPAGLSTGLRRAAGGQPPLSGPSRTASASAQSVARVTGVPVSREWTGPIAIGSARAARASSSVAYSGPGWPGRRSAARAR